MSSVQAPWTDEQVACLVLWQESNYVHSYTCPNRGETLHGHQYGDIGGLKPTPDGWVCLDCDYTQDWAHDFSLMWKEPEHEVAAGMEGVDGPEVPVGTEVIAVAHTWPTNADLLTDAAFPILRSAGLWADTDSALDVTYHTGRWWLRYRPTVLEWHSREETPAFDFRELPHPADSFDLVVFDPPYVAKGGASASAGFADRFDIRYGIGQRERPDDLLAMNSAGLLEAIRVARTVVLLKSMDFVSEGVLHCHTSALESVARSAGWEVYERFIHLPTGTRPQPSNRRVLRGRQRPSTLTVLVPYKLRRGRPR